MIDNYLNNCTKTPRLSLTVVFCLIATVAFSQLRIETANELKLNLASTLLLYPEIQYEKVRSSEYISFVKSDFFGYGFSAGARIPGLKRSSDPDYYDDNYGNFPKIYENNFHILAFCRFYFNRMQEFHFHYDLKRPVLFFIEPTAAIVGFNDLTTLFIGFGGGIKFINVKNYTAEIHLGGGGSLKKTQNSGKFYERYEGVGYYRFGINIGKRW